MLVRILFLVIFILSVGAVFHRHVPDRWVIYLLFIAATSLTGAICYRTPKEVRHR